MNYDLYIGIDPGLSGGIAFIPKHGNPWAVKMPETDRDLFEVLENVAGNDLMEGNDCFCYLEAVHSSPQMGVKSAFTFGFGLGRLKMALTACSIPYESVRPQVWQKAMGCLTKGDKNVSKRKAQELFPSIKVAHWNSDALLIAEYCRRTVV